MKIKYNKTKPLTFKDLVNGDVFFVTGIDSPLMKVVACKAASGDGYSNAVYLNCGSLIKIEESQQVLLKRNAYLGFEEDDEI